MRLVIVEGSVEEVEQLLEEWYGRLPRILSAVPNGIDVGTVMAAVFTLTGYGIDALIDPVKSREVTYARCLAMFLLRHDAKMGPTAIGRLLQRDHSTVVNSIRRIELEMKTRPETTLDVDKLRLLMAGQAERGDDDMNEQKPGAIETGEA